MDILFHKEKLKVLLEDLSSIIKTPVSIFDKDFRYVVSNVGVSMSEYCAMIRSNSSLCAKCEECDLFSLRKCKELGCGFSYKCHAQLCETVEAIKHDGNIVGYIIFGQYRQSENESLSNEFLVSYQGDKARLVSAYEKLSVLSDRQVVSVRNILKSCILSYYLSEATSISGEGLANKIAEFIECNIEQKLTANMISQLFYVSKKKLYELFRRNFNKTYSEYVVSKRISCAKNLLKTTQLSVTEVAQKSGFFEYNYFIQKFKKECGITPLQFRKREQK